MRRSITAILAALAALGSLVPPVQAATMISGTIEGDSTLTPSAPGVFAQNFTGDGEDATFGSFTPVAQSTIDFSHPPSITVSNGMFSETFAEGVLLGTTSGTGAASGHGTADVTIDFVFTGGTGIFTGATGEATLTGTITSTSPTTESITGTYTGSLSLSLPEPGNLANLIPAAGVGALVLLRRRRQATATAHRRVNQRT